MENNNKTQAELYREERKARLAKEAAKKAKKSPAGEKTKKLVTKIVAIVLAVIIGLGAIYASLDFFGVPQKVLKVKVDNTEYSFSLAEYNFYYYSMVLNYTQTAYQYDTYYGEGSGIAYLGYDYTKTPDNQEYSEDYVGSTGYTIEDLGNPEEPTWEHVFKRATIEQIVQVKYAVSKANEEKITLTEEEQKNIDDSIAEFETSAKKNDYSLDRYLRANYGNGISEKLLRQIFEEEALATSYFTKLQEKTRNDITEEQINDRYNNNKNDFDSIDMRIYAFSVEAEYATDATKAEKEEAETKADAEAKKRADNMLALVKDEKTFIEAVKGALITDGTKEDEADGDKSSDAYGTDYASLESSSEELAKWAFDSTRKAGDKAVIKGEDVYYVAFIVKLPYKNVEVVSNDVRHILVKFPDENTDGTPTSTKDENNNTVTNITAETKAESKKKADAILEEYKKNPTEDNFIALAKEKSDDGSRAEGGLIEGVADDGTYVEAFTNWSVDPARKVGDTDVIETEYGYHVMYYVKAGEQTWHEDVKNTILNENYAKVTTDVLDEFYKNVETDSLLLNWTTNDQNKLIGNIILYNFA